MENMKKAIITLSFDDGRKDNYQIAKEVLETRNLPATFNITTGFIENKLDMGDIPLSKEEIIEISNNHFFEVAGHGHMHKNDMEDIEQGKNILKEWINLNEQESIGFASPGSGMTLEYINVNKEQLKKMGFCYIRISGRWQTKKFVRVAARKISRVIHSSFLYKVAYVDTLMDKTEGIVVFSIPVINDITVSQLVKMVREAKKQNKWCVFMFHSIKKKGDDSYNDPWSWDYNKFVEFANVLKKMRDAEEIEVMTTKAAYELINRGR